MVVFNRKVAVFRSAFLGVSPADRAHRAQRVIREILDKGGPGKVTTGKENDRGGIFVDGELALVLTESDADLLRAEALDSALATSADRLATAITATREARDQSRILRSAIVSGVATLIFMALVWITLRIRNWLVTKLVDPDIPVGQAQPAALGHR